MKFKTIFAKMTVCSLMLTTLFGCGQASQTANGAQDTQSAQTTELTVFAAASMTETLNRIAEDYKAVDPNVTLTFNFASSGDLLTQIKEGADCDVFISAAPKQMNALDGSLKDDTDKNPDGLDELLGGTRIDLLENKVTLAVPEGNPKGIESFDQLAELLASGEARSISAATRAVELSRSAFYKYKDCIFDSENGREVITVMATLRDETGALQSLLAGISAAGASIVTINQSTPENGAALVAVTIRTDTMQMSPEELTEKLSRQRMVVSVRCGYNL